MNTHRFIKHLFAVALVLGGSISLSSAVAAELTSDGDINRAWSRLDHPVASGSISRTWFWGPTPITELLEESYLNAPGGKRLVIYFDKTRMEINAGAEPGSTWRVTNGLLATELITGQVQLGDSAFSDAAPPEINVAGDPDDPDGPTYRSLSGLTDADALPEGTPIVQRVSRNGTVANDERYSPYGVTAQRYIPETGHTVASVFWEYMTGEGTVYIDGEYRTGPLFDHFAYGVGYPITEAYWTTVRVAGETRPVLIQAFQRRVMSYTPDNPPGWEVEAGNVGQHYRDWHAMLGDLNSQTGRERSTPDEDESGQTNEQANQCNERSVNVSENGTVKQSNSATINQSGGNQTVTCTQKNVTVKK